MVTRFVCDKCKRMIRLGWFAKLIWNGNCCGCEDPMRRLGKDEVCTYEDDTDRHMKARFGDDEYETESSCKAMYYSGTTPIMLRKDRPKNLVLEDEPDQPLDEHKFD